MEGARSRSTRPLVVVFALLVCTTVLGCSVVPARGYVPVASPRSPEVYLSLGDSWVSGPLVPDPVGDPIDCGRSSRNWPTLVAQRLEVAEFVDVSCGSASSKHLFEEQRAPLGSPAPPQLDALTKDTTLVTIGIGGNDVGLPTFALRCLSLVREPLGPPPFGQPCAERLTEDGVDAISERIEEARLGLRHAFGELRRRAPRARILVVGYPTALPHDGPGCWPTVPLLEPDVHYLRDKFVEMNRMIEREAVRARLEFVDTYTSSVGHDVCQPVGIAWVNGLTLDPPAIPMHPNEFSHRHTADVVAAAILGTR